MQAGYQITQQRQPLAIGGPVDYLTRVTQDKRWWYEPSRAHLIQIQLEQDSGKSLYDPKESVCLIDLNRAGIPPKQCKFQFYIRDFISTRTSLKKLTSYVFVVLQFWCFRAKKQLSSNVELPFTGNRRLKTIKAAGMLNQICIGFKQQWMFKQFCSNHSLSLFCSQELAWWKSWLNLTFELQKKRRVLCESCRQYCADWVPVMVKWKVSELSIEKEESKQWSHDGKACRYHHLCVLRAYRRNWSQLITK